MTPDSDSPFKNLPNETGIVHSLEEAAHISYSDYSEQSHCRASGRNWFKEERAV